MSDIKDQLLAVADSHEFEEHTVGRVAFQGAAELSRLRAENERLRDALAWYGEQARLARLIHSEGDRGRSALAGDGGERARKALEGE